MTNLFPNFNFSQGYYPFTETVDGVVKTYDNMAIPNGTIFWYDRSDTMLPTQTTKFTKPENVVWPKEQAPLAAKWYKNQSPTDEQAVLFSSQNYLTILKIFNSWTSGHWKWGAKVPTVVGSKYKIAFPVFPDLVDNDTEGYKVPAGDVKSGQFKINCGIESTEYVNLSLVKNLKYTNIEHEFTAKTPETEITLEYLGLHGLHNNGLFVGYPILELVSVGTGGTTTPSGTTQTTPNIVSSYEDIQLALKALALAEQYLDMCRVALGIAAQKEIPTT